MSSLRHPHIKKNEKTSSLSHLCITNSIINSINTPSDYQKLPHRVIYISKKRKEHSLWVKETQRKEHSLWVSFEKKEKNFLFDSSTHHELNQWVTTNDTTGTRDMGRVQQECTQTATYYLRLQQTAIDCTNWIKESSRTTHLATREMGREQRESTYVWHMWFIRAKWLIYMRKHIYMTRSYAWPTHLTYIYA